MNSAKTTRPSYSASSGAAKSSPASPREELTELTYKYDLIASLEENIVRMSLELAKAKAFENEYRCRRRVPNEDVTEERSEEKESRPRPPIMRATTVDVQESKMDPASIPRDKSYPDNLSLSLGAMSWGPDEVSLDGSASFGSLGSVSWEEEERRFSIARWYCRRCGKQRLAVGQERKGNGGNFASREVAPQKERGVSQAKYLERRLHII